MTNAAESGPTVKKFFTVQSANKMLPLVRSIATDIVAKYREREELRARVDLLRGTRREGLSSAHREEVEQIEHEFERITEEFCALADELRSLGVELKGPDGLVDFPAIHDNREVCLCWKLGEPEVMFWHNSDAGFAGRQRVTDDMFAATSKS